MDETKIINEAEIIQLIREERWDELDRLIAEQHPADVADLMELLPSTESLEVFKRLSLNIASEVLDETSGTTRMDLLTNVEPEHLADLLEELPMDDAIEILEDLPEPITENLIELMEPADAEEVRQAFEFEKQSAGRLMTTDVVALRSGWTVEQALSRGLAVIIDNHEYHAMADDPMGKKDMFLSTWKQLAEHFKDFPDEVYFGVLNEPNGNLTSYLWNYFCADAIGIIRESNPTRTLVIGPGRWNSIQQLEFLELPEDDRNIIVDIHYYSPHRFTHQGASWSQGSEAWLGTTWRGNPEEKQAVMDDIKIAVDWAREHDRPLYLGEFGVYKKADMESRKEWLTFVVQEAEANRISWAIWDLMGTSFGIWDESNNGWIEPLKEAILQSQ